jgi:hypothetical protein
LSIGALRVVSVGRTTTGTDASRNCWITGGGPASTLPITTVGENDRMPSALSARW